MKKQGKQTKLFKKVINAKWAFYWSKFLLATAEICRKNTKIVKENEGTEHEYEHCSCEGCPLNVKEFKYERGKITGCILSPDCWDDPKIIGHITGATIRHIARGGADHGKEE